MLLLLQSLYDSTYLCIYVQHVQNSDFGLRPSSALDAVRLALFPAFSLLHATSLLLLLLVAHIFHS